MSIVIFGDLHFNDERPWSLEAGKEVIRFLREECPENNKHNIGIFLGDITEKATISPLVYELLFEFLNSLKFKATFLLRGNHDIKKKKGKIISPLSFLSMKDSPYPYIQYVTDPTKIDLEGINCVFLPFKSHSEEQGMDIYKEGLDPSWYEDKEALVLGHFADTSNPDVREGSIDLTKFQGRVVLGHIHNPISDHYIGSVIPNAYSEKSYKRSYRVYSSFDKYEEKTIPSILEYLDVKFPSPLPKASTKVPVYTIFNCQSAEAAIKLYQDIYIRKCVYDNLVDADSFNKTLSLADEKSLVKTIDKWLESQKVLSESIKKKVKKYLTN